MTGGLGNFSDTEWKPPYTGKLLFTSGPVYHSTFIEGELLKILHLYSNHKWTGPADHALNLVDWLGQQSGVSSHFACGWRKGTQNFLRSQAERRNLKLVQGFHLAKHLSWRIVPDVIQLRRLVKNRGYDLIHSHLNNDMLTAVAAGCARRLVRTVYAGEPWELDWRERAGFSRAAMILTASKKVQDYLTGVFPDKFIRHVQVPVDLTRFESRPKNSRLLKEFCIAENQLVAGIVARVQPHRRFDLLLESLKLVVLEIPDIKFLIIGRGTHLDEIAGNPVLQMGLQDNVVFTGYRSDDYADVLNLLDFKVFLVPGSDGACRAVREALACAIPVIATRRGLLPELITEGETGHLIEETPDSLARAMIDLCRNQIRLGKLAENARKFAVEHLSPERYVSLVIQCYNDLTETCDQSNN